MKLGADVLPTGVSQDSTFPFEQRGAESERIRKWGKEMGSDHANMLNIKWLPQKYGLISILGAFLGVKKRF